jgi:hypothetical protein
MPKIIVKYPEDMAVETAVYTVVGRRNKNDILWVEAREISEYQREAVVTLSKMGKLKASVPFYSVV